MIKVLLADDHQIVLEGFQLLLDKEDDIEVIHQALNGQEVLSCLNKALVDVAVLDIEMPILDGIDTTKEIVKHFPGVKVLILTMYNKKDFITEMIRAGASGYVLKERGLEELTKAIRLIAKGGEHFGDKVTKTLIEALKHQGPEKSEENKIHLTKREVEILGLIGQGLSSPQISKKLFIAKTTVDTHRRNLIDKLGVANSKALIIYAIENGYLNGDQES